MHTYSYTFRQKNGYGVAVPGDFLRPTHCHECREALPPVSDTGGIGYGCRDYVAVGNTRAGVPIEQAKAVCYACCHKQDTEAMRDRTKPFGAYVSSDGKHVSNWPGGILATVIRENATRGNMGKIVHYRCVDVHGAHWYGKNAGRGTYITLRPCKA